MRILPMTNYQMQTQNNNTNKNMNFGAMRVSAFAKGIVDRLRPNKYTSLTDILVEVASNPETNKKVINAFNNEGQYTSIDAILDRIMPGFQRSGNISSPDFHILLNEAETDAFRLLLRTCERIENFSKNFMADINKFTKAPTFPDEEAALIKTQLDTMGKGLDMYDK